MKIHKNKSYDFGYLYIEDVYTNKEFQEIHNEIKNYNIKTTSVLESILAKDWSGSVIRSNDTRLNIENDWIKANGMIIPDWETRVSDVVKNILSSRELI